MKQKWIRLNGNSLIEVLSSLSILSLLIGICLQLILQFNGIFSPYQQWQSLMMVEAAFFTQEKGIPLSNRWQKQSRQFESSIQLIGKKDLMVHEIACYFKKQTLFQRNRLLKR